MVLAVLINGLSTSVGFGSLLIADHRGIFGLGLLLTLGSLLILFASLVVVPVLLPLTGGGSGSQVDRESPALSPGAGTAPSRRGWSM